LMLLLTETLPKPSGPSSAASALVTAIPAQDLGSMSSLPRRPYRMPPLVVVGRSSMLPG
jgi:hypothetical protein